jgi:integrase
MNDIVVCEMITEPRKRSKEVQIVNKSDSYYDNFDIKYCSVDEVISLIEGVQDNPFYQMIYLLLYETASRIEEARHIRFCDIDFSSGKIKVKTLKQRSKNVYRVLKISSRLSTLILLYQKNKHLLDGDFVLSKRSSNKAISNVAVWRMLRKHVASILGDRLVDEGFAHPHMFRHSRAIHLIDSGVNISILKDFLGHKSIQNTLIYTKFSNQAMLSAIVESNSCIGLL